MSIPMMMMFLMSICVKHVVEVFNLCFVHLLPILFQLQNTELNSELESTWGTEWMGTSPFYSQQIHNPIDFHIVCILLCWFGRVWRSGASIPTTPEQLFTIGIIIIIITIITSDWIESVCYFTTLCIYSRLIISIWLKRLNRSGWKTNIYGFHWMEREAKVSV